MNEASSGDFTITRVFDAPRTLVWRAYTEIEHLSKWWGPKGFTWLSGRLDFRPGGVFLYGMRGPAGQEMWGKFVYREIVPPERMVYVNSFSDQSGGTTRAPFPGEFPLEWLNTLTFAEHGAKTTLTLRSAPLNATEAERAFFETLKPSMNQGYSATLDQLAAYLANMRAE